MDLVHMQLLQQAYTMSSITERIWKTDGIEMQCFWWRSGSDDMSAAHWIVCFITLLSPMSICLSVRLSPETMRRGRPPARVSHMYPPREKLSR